MRKLYIRCRFLCLQIKSNVDEGSNTKMYEHSRYFVYTMIQYCFISHEKKNNFIIFSPIINSTRRYRVYEN